MTKIGGMRAALLRWTLIAAALALALNAQVNTKQGVDGTVTVKKIPLYVKICGFLYRDYQYGRLAGEITRGVPGDSEKVTALYLWTRENIRRPPEGFTVVDDHIWNIVIRGYGCADQASDVFTTLASYAGYEAFWEKCFIKGVKGSVILSFVFVNGNWSVFDVDNGRAFPGGKALDAAAPSGRSYSEYMAALDKGLFKRQLRRPDKQKIFGRIVYEARKLTGR